MAVALMADTVSAHEEEVRNEKHRILLDAKKAAAAAGAAGDANYQAALLHDISTPLGQMFTFFRQNKAFLRNMEFDVRMTVNSEGAHDALFTRLIGALPRTQGLTVHACRC